MSVELSIFKLFCMDRDQYLLHKQHITSLENMERELKLMFSVLEDYYDQDDTHNSISADGFMDYFTYMYPRSRDTDMVREIVTNAFEKDTPIEITEGLLDQLHEKHVATAVVEKLLPVMAGDRYGVMPEVKLMAEEYVDSMHHKPAELEVPEPCTKTVRELIQQEVLDKGMPWWLNSITDVIGGVRPKSLGLIYAFVDSGKSSFALKNVRKWCDFLPEGRDIIYAGNEECKDRLRLRLVQAFLEKPWPWLEANYDEADELIETEHPNFNRVHIFDDITSATQITYLLKNYNPAVLVVDQATDVEVKTSRRADGVEYMKQLFKWYRRQANIYDCGIVGVSQGVGDAENKKWLKLSDIYGSRVAIQGALDYAIGIGRRVDDPTLENKRYLHIPKNKLNGGEGGRISAVFYKLSNEWREA